MSLLKNALPGITEAAKLSFLIDLIHKMFVIVLIDTDTSGINNNMKIRF